MIWAAAVKRMSGSLPSRGAWIEISVIRHVFDLLVSLPSRGAWIEINIVSGLIVDFASLPSRGAWIEIAAKTLIGNCISVAPFAGSVD